MGCGCKDKKVVAPAQQPARIKYVENSEKKSPPVPSPVVPAQEVENIINKLDEISA